MKCMYCKDTGKYKQPNDKDKFDRLVEIEMDKAYFISYEMAEQKVYDRVGYTVIDCPFCETRNK